MMSSMEQTGHPLMSAPRRQASSKRSMPSGAKTRSPSNGPFFNWTKSFPRRISLVSRSGRSPTRRSPGSRAAAWRAFLEPPLPAHRGPRERAVIRAALQGALPALRIDAEVERGIRAAQQAEAAAQAVAAPVLRGRKADPRRPDEAAPERKPVADRPGLPGEVGGGRQT